MYHYWMFHWLDLSFLGAGAGLPHRCKMVQLFGGSRDLEKAVEQLSQMLNEPIEDVEIKDLRQRITNKMVGSSPCLRLPTCVYAHPQQCLVFYYPLITAPVFAFPAVAFMASNMSIITIIVRNNSHRAEIPMYGRAKFTSNVPVDYAWSL